MMLSRAFSRWWNRKGRRGYNEIRALNERGIIAATVDGMSARIGDGESVYNDGVISHFNSEPKSLVVKLA